jgi:chromosome segregation ATPase
MTTHRDASELAHHKEEGIEPEMSTDLEVRVTVLEQGFQKLQSTADCALTLARHADRDQGDFKARQDAFQRSLNALQETQGEHTARLNGIDKRLDGIDNRLDGIDIRLDGIDNRLDGIDNRLDGIDNRLDSIDNRLDRNEKEMRQGFAHLGTGQDVITKMLTKAIEGNERSSRH